MNDDEAEPREVGRGGLIGALAGELWAGLEIANQFPRRIEDAASFRFPLSFIHLPVVTVALIRRWASDRRMSAAMPPDDRELMGCLLSYRGHGYAFICSNDLDIEQRLTAAHETAHFILDYLLPRRQVLAALGESVTPVLDGQRHPTIAERAAALLSHVRLGPHVHLFPRRGLTEEDDIQVAAAEARADVLAMELVAPQFRIDEQIALCRPSNSPAMHLATYFGLPAYAFRRAILASQPRALPRVLQLARAARLPRAEREPS